MRTRSSTLLLTSGRSMTRLSVSTSPIDADEVASTLSAATVTSTDCVTVPTSNVKFNRTGAPGLTLTSLYANGLKPGNSAATLYTPGRTAGKLYAPDSFDTV